MTHGVMNNFPIAFEDALETFMDPTERSLKSRLRRLSYAIDLLWENPSHPKAAQYYALRLGKLLRGANHCRLFSRRIVLMADYYNHAEDMPEEGDIRETVFLDEQHLDQSFSAVEDFFSGALPPGHAGDIMRGMGVVFLNFFILVLLRKIEQIEYAKGDLNFPVNLYARLDHIISQHGGDWYRDTILRDRFTALQVMMDVDGLNPDDGVKVNELVAKLKKDSLRELVRKDYLIRMRIYELYHKVRPFFAATRARGYESADRKDIIANADLLMDYICGLDAFTQVRADRKEQIRDKIERRLAQAIGTAGDDLGWHIYRGLRARAGRGKFRTEYLFQKLLENDAARLGVLNRIYAHKKIEIGPSHPEYAQLPQLTMSKYQPLFKNKISHDPGADAFILAEKSIEIDLGAAL